MLARLLLDNMSGKLCSGGGQRGFLDKRNSGGGIRRLCGVGTFLHERTTVFPKLSKKQYRARKSDNLCQPKRKASNLKAGNYFHKQIYHALLCIKGTCVCPAAATKTAAVRKSSACFPMVQAAQQFIIQQSLVPLCGEKVIAAPHVGMGTRFDMLCERQPGYLVLVSWKTAGTTPWHPNTTELDLQALICQRPNDQTPSEVISGREHCAQLACELYMCRELHKLPVEEAWIVYLSPGSSQYRAVKANANSIQGQGYKRAWEWILSQQKQS